MLAESRPVFAAEPPSHERLISRARGFGRLVSNAIMLSPPEHPFWTHVLKLVVRCRSAAGPLDATGPMLLTAAIEQAPEAEQPRVLSAHVFTNVDRDGRPVLPERDGAPSLAAHHWTGSWYRRSRPNGRIGAMKTWLRRSNIVWRHGPDGPDRTLQRRIDREALMRAAPPDGAVLIAVPVRNAAATLDRLFASIAALIHPRGGLSIAFLVGDTVDDSAARIAAFRQADAHRFNRFTVIEQSFGAPAYRKRWAARVQRERRTRIARVRNLLLDRALADEDWVLWIDADILSFPPDALIRLMASGSRIATPNCVVRPGGRSFDLNAWVEDRTLTAYQHYKYIVDGLYAPPIGLNRVYLSDMRYHDRVALDSVGGAMLLVDAQVHRAGIVFPESPYNRLIETEGFAALARDMGIVPVGMPNLEIVHANA